MSERRLTCLKLWERETRIKQFPKEIQRNLSRTNSSTNRLKRTWGSLLHVDEDESLMVPSMQWLSFDSLSDHNTALLRSPKLEPGICVMKDSAAKRIAIPCALLLSILFAATGSLFAQQPTQPLPAPQVEM